MGGGATKYRNLSRSSAHRQAMLRNLVTSLLKHETITTTWAKAKETQSLAEKIITLGKKNTVASRMKAGQFFYEPLVMVPKLVNEICPRYLLRPGGYTRCLRMAPREFDGAEMAVLSLVDGPKDMRYFLTAQTVARDRMLGHEHSVITEMNVRSCTNTEIKGSTAKDDFEKVVKWYIKAEKEGLQPPEVEYNTDPRPASEVHFM